MSWIISSTALWMLYIVNTGKNDSTVIFRFEELPAFSIEENTAFDVAEVAITRCWAVAAFSSFSVNFFAEVCVVVDWDLNTVDVLPYSLSCSTVGTLGCNRSEVHVLLVLPSRTRRIPLSMPCGCYEASYQAQSILRFRHRISMVLQPYRSRVWTAHPTPLSPSE